MSSGTSDKISGHANEAAGNIKRGISEALNSEKLQAQGIAQEAKGKAQQASGAAKEKVREVANAVAENINKHV